jgi:hypothetical protein
MARRETFTVDLSHPGCESKGEATIEENENPVYSRGVLRPVVRSIPKGFQKRGDEIICKACKEAVWRRYD